MNEYIILSLVYVVFLVSSYLAYRNALRLRRGMMYIAIVIYFILIYAYFELVNTIHIHLRNKGVFLEFGHASILLIWVLIISFLTGIGFVILLLRKSKRSAKAVDS